MFENSLFFLEFSNEYTLDAYPVPWRSLNTGHVGMRMISKTGGGI